LNPGYKINFVLFFAVLPGIYSGIPTPSGGEKNLSSLVGGKISPHPPQIKNREASLGVRVLKKIIFCGEGENLSFLP